MNRPKDGGTTPPQNFGNYLVFTTRHGVHISEDLDLRCFARSGLHTDTTKPVGCWRQDLDSQPALADSRLSEHAIDTLNSKSFKFKRLI
jgi:hypothetical protein